MARVLVACEFSGVVREAFRCRGHEAWSCDRIDSEAKLCGECWPAYSNYNEPHFKCDVLELPKMHWDLMIAHPPCTFLASSGARWFSKRMADQDAAVWFAKQLGNASWADRCVVENPIGVLSTKWRKPDQIIQPWMFGHGETKATCLWLKGLPPLVPTNIVEGRTPRVHYASPGPDRWKERSRTLTGIAEAMAEQWGSLL